MTPEMIIALCTGIATIITATGAFIMTLRTNKKINTQATRGLQRDRKIEQIHGLVNDKYDKALAVIAGQAEAISKLTGTEGDRALAAKALSDSKGNLK